MSESYPAEAGRSGVALGVSSRAQFIARTYNHLFGAVLAFTGLEILYFQSGIAQTIAPAMLGVSWLLVLGAFMVVSWIASRAAHTSQSTGTQYTALAGYVLAQSILFVPLLYIANTYAPGVIQSAATVTVIGFAGLTALVFTMRKDFSFLASFLRWGGVVALLLIVGSILFGFHMGTWFSVAMIAFAGSAILYDTSNVIHHFPEDRHVGAALELFASVALMFWYILQFFMGSDD